MITPATTYPTTVVEAVDAFLRNLPPDLFDVIKVMAEDDLHRVHFTAGCFHAEG